MFLPCDTKGTPVVSSPDCDVILKFNAAIDWATDTIMLLSLISLLPSSVVDMIEGLFIMPSVWSETVEPRLSVIKRSGLLPPLPNFRSLYPIYLPRQVSWWHHMGHDMIWASYWPLNHLQFSSFLAFLFDWYCSPSVDCWHWAWSWVVSVRDLNASSFWLPSRSHFWQILLLLMPQVSLWSIIARTKQNK